MDERTVDIILKRPDPILPNKLASIFIMSKSWSEKNNATRPQNTRAREEMHTTRNTNGTGAYRLASREPDVRTVLARNEAWWGWGAEGNAGNVTEIVYRPIASDATRIAALLSGEVDFVHRPAAAGPEPAARRAGGEGARGAGGPDHLPRLWTWRGTSCCTAT